MAMQAGLLTTKPCVLIALLSMGKVLIRKETKWEYQVSVKPVFGENLH